MEINNTDSRRGAQIFQEASLIPQSATYDLKSCMPFNVIALRLGHVSTTIIHRYVEADLATKEKALAQLDVPDIQMRRYRATDSLMRFLHTL